jgi:hypothetical protein
MRDTPHEDVVRLTPVELYERRFTELVRIFIKDEPHKLAKVEAGRWRLIMSVSLSYSIAQAVLYQDSIDEDVRRNSSIPSKPGWVSTDLGYVDLYMWVRRFVRPPMSMDVAAWDWSVPYCLMALEAECYIACNKASPSWANMIRNETFCTASSVISSSQGDLFVFHKPGIVKSGGRRTAQANSRSRDLLSFLTDRKVNPNSTDHWSMTMGDDCVEESLSMDPNVVKAAYLEYGFNLKDIVYGYPFEFCSMRFVAPHVAIPLNWPRSVFRLINKDYEFDDMEAFMYEMRHLKHSSCTVKLRDLVLLLRQIGWLPSADLGWYLSRC